MQRFLITIFLFFGFSTISQATNDAAHNYKKHCASCHGENRLGSMAPALLPVSLKRLRKLAAEDSIVNGRAATQMPAYKDKLSSSEIKDLVAFLYTAPKVTPTWSDDDIKSTHRVMEPQLTTGTAKDAKPVYSADPLNVFLVVEGGDHHVTVLDGDKFEPITRFKSHYALHGGPKFSSDGRFVYFASRDGWISKYDMYNLKMVAEVRAGINTRNAAVSADDRYVLVGNYLPRTLELLDARDLSLIKTIPVQDDFGNTSRVSAVYSAPPRESFVIALKDIKQIWELYTSDHPPTVFHGAVHDFKMAEGLAEKGRFPIKRFELDDYMDDFFFDQSYNNVMGAARNARNGQVVSLITGGKIANLDLTGMPHLGSGITWKRDGTTILATPNLKEAKLTFIDMKTWKNIKVLKTPGPGFFLRSHENSPYAWADVFFGPNKDQMLVIDKETLEIVKTIIPEPGKTSAHVEFTRDGRYALVSIWEMDGAVVVYDAKTLKEVKRLPMSKPVGKYNVYNKITRSEGTSH
ncbi:MAG: cytochrome D1 domain-containing protein [bacterium]